MTWPNIIGLGEMMNFPGVVYQDEKMLAEIAATQRAAKTVGGHYASPDLGRPFHGYVAGGPADDHEGTRLEDAVARVRQGMRAMLRLGSAWYDVAAQVKAVTELGLDPRNFILCTDDCHSGTLVRDGHMDRVVRHAIAQGLKPITAIQMATLNTAQHFGLERELGSITPGRRADLILTSDLRDAAGRDGHRARQGHGGGRHASRPTSRPTPIRPARAARSGSAARSSPRISTSPHRPGVKTVKARVIGVIENQAPTRALSACLPCEDGLVGMDRANDVCQIALVERHRGTGKVVNAFVSGFGYTADCAVASTVAHDSHHMIVVGTSKADMAQAANRLAEVGGGVVVVSARARSWRWSSCRSPASCRTSAPRSSPPRPIAWSRPCAVAAAAQQCLYAALAARPRRHPGAAHLRPRPYRRDDVQADGAARVDGARHWQGMPVHQPAKALTAASLTLPEAASAIAWPRIATAASASARVKTRGGVSSSTFELRPT